MRAFVIGLGLALAVAGAIVAHASKTPRQLVDLNRATLLELMQLPGVGPSRAEAIVRYRDGHPFRRTADLLRIKGIGRRTFARLRPFVTVGQPAADSAAVASASAAVAKPAVRVPAPVVKPAAARVAAPVGKLPAARAPARPAKPPATATGPVPGRPAAPPVATPRATPAGSPPVCDSGAGGGPQACSVPWRSERSGGSD